ncbi:recombinase family protein [Streptomyces scabiei]|uniref:recombinase family protein n=1 Tax=Streptomyces scabiei TaxID=1930 RepID=UPI0036E49015
MRAAIYVRLSRETDETTSPERQRAACEALCEARGWEVVAAEEDIDRDAGVQRARAPAPPGPLHRRSGPVRIHGRPPQRGGQGPRGQ